MPDWVGVWFTTNVPAQRVADWLCPCRSTAVVMISAPWLATIKEVIGTGPSSIGRINREPGVRTSTVPEMTCTRAVRPSEGAGAAAPAGKPLPRALPPVTSEASGALAVVIDTSAP
jgi:hypothetical protein